MTQRAILRTDRAVAALACAAPPMAQDRTADYPKRPVRVVIRIAPGGGLDIMTRLAVNLTLK